MYRPGFKLSALLLLALVAIHAQCLAYCAFGVCPLSAATAHSHCRHHAPDGKQPLNSAAIHCTPEQAFLVRASSPIPPASALAPLYHPVSEFFESSRLLSAARS